MINILSAIKLLGFLPKDGESNVYNKKYNGYEIKIKYNADTPQKSEIDYGDKILCVRKTTCNFHQDETLVVLECVNRLLEKGYKPENIELEKSWGLGHTDGYLDILVKDEQNNSFAMIECKTWGKEYDKYVKETFTHKNKGSKENDGGQIFSYLQQEPKKTKAICYYTSHINGKDFEYENAIIHNKEDWVELNQIERFKHWSKTFETNGIFEDDIPLYRVESKAIRRKDLKELKREDSEGIYNQFAEILRHNVVSDKPNAFNKIINMFLCKIWDEDRAENEEVKFQIRTLGRDKTDEELLEDLNDLYKAGMNAYLEKDVSDVTKDDFELLLNFVNNPTKKNEFEELYKTLRLYKNNEFAFKEVFDKKSFKDNAKVVREVVELLQYKQLRYSHKQQFLGDFFEKLLNDSIKQEAGQFFTPVPLTQFIIKSLPIKEIIQNKIKNNEPDTLPYVIDYACGTGHFLTEAMDHINKIIKEDIDIEKISKPAIKKDFRLWKNSDFEWAEKYIYGIDLDYRLIKASKISCFLNGDGKANLLHTNGLAPFNSADYIGKLHSNKGKQDNQQFDILIANPPYSIEAFKQTVSEGENSFILYNYITDNSKEIECLFIERAKQLLKTNGVAGIIIPASIFINTPKKNILYYETRKMLLRNFKIKGVLCLKNNAFKSADIDTLILFLEKRNEAEHENIRLYVEKFFTDYLDFNINGMENIVSKYINDVYSELNFDEYVKKIQQSPNEHEKDKLEFYILSCNNNLILANSGEKTVEKEFLGYEFSDRSGYEGINLYSDSDLFDSNNVFNDKKLNYYIYKNYLNKDNFEIIANIKNNETHPLNKHIDICKLSELINFKDDNFSLQISTYRTQQINYQSKLELKKLEKYLDVLESGSRDSKMGTKKLKNGIPSLGGSHIGLKGNVVYDKMRYVDEKYYEKCSQGIIKKQDILLCKDGAQTGKVAFVENDYEYSKSMVNEHVFVIRANNNELKQKYLFYLLYASELHNILKVKSKRAGQPSLNRPNVLNLMIPVPQNQNDIIKELDEYFYSTEAKLKNPDIVRQKLQAILDKYLK